MHSVAESIRRLEQYPPFQAMGVRVLELTADWSIVRLLLPLTDAARNMGGAMFGGYQAAIADPIAALAVVRRFPAYSVWTRSMTIDFLYEGNSDLELRFEFPETLQAHIETELRAHGRSNPRFEYGLQRSDGILCTRVNNTVAVRAKGYQRTAPVAGAGE